MSFVENCLDFRWVMHGERAGGKFHPQAGYVLKILSVHAREVRLMDESWS